MLNFLKDSIIVTSMFNELILIITSHAGNLPLSQIENSNHSTDILQLQLYSVNFFSAEFCSEANGMVFLYFEKNLDKTRVKSLFQSHLTNLHLPLFLLILFLSLSHNCLNEIYKLYCKITP